MNINSFDVAMPFMYFFRSFCTSGHGIINSLFETIIVKQIMLLHNNLCQQFQIRECIWYFKGAWSPILDVEMTTTTKAP